LSLSHPVSVLPLYVPLRHFLTFSFPLFSAVLPLSSFHMLSSLFLFICSASFSLSRTFHSVPLSFPLPLLSFFSSLFSSASVPSLFSPLSFFNYIFISAVVPLDSDTGHGPSQLSGMRDSSPNFLTTSYSHLLLCFSPSLSQSFPSSRL
jgi:hypothetical protein